MLNMQTTVLLPRIHLKLTFSLEQTWIYLVCYWLLYLYLEIFGLTSLKLAFSVYTNTFIVYKIMPTFG